jgi:hypothetical protein
LDGIHIVEIQFLGRLFPERQTHPTGPLYWFERVLGWKRLLIRRATAPFVCTVAWGNRKGNTQVTCCW